MQLLSQASRFELKLRYRHGRAEERPNISFIWTSIVCINQFRLPQQLFNVFCLLFSLLFRVLIQWDPLSNVSGHRLTQMRRKRTAWV